MNITGYIYILLQLITEMKTGQFCDYCYHNLRRRNQHVEQLKQFENGTVKFERFYIFPQLPYVPETCMSENIKAVLVSSKLIDTVFD